MNLLLACGPCLEASTLKGIPVSFYGALLFTLWILVGAGLALRNRPGRVFGMHPGRWFFAWLVVSMFSGGALVTAALVVSLPWAMFLGSHLGREPRGVGSSFHRALLAALPFLVVVTFLRLRLQYGAGLSYAIGDVGLGVLRSGIYVVVFEGLALFGWLQGRHSAPAERAARAEQRAAQWARLHRSPVAGPDAESGD
jgi:hypothetical protein